MLNYDYVYPVKIIRTEGDVSSVEKLLLKPTLQVGITWSNPIVLKGKASIILDFGKELSGGVRIFTYCYKGTDNVRIRFGESVAETSVELGYKNACNAHSPRDFYVRPCNLSDNTFGQTGFRFVRIDTVSDDAELTLKGIVAAVDIDKREYEGSFVSDDDVLNQIFDTASYTLRLCMQNAYFWDGIKRDRLVWIGDLYPEMRAGFALFSTLPETFNSLKNAVEDNPLPKWVNTIPLYSAWWLIIFCENYLHNGNMEEFNELLPYAKGVIEQINGFILEDGTTNFHHNFIDWPTHYTAPKDSNCPIDEISLIKKNDELVGINYLLKITFTKVKELFEELSLDVTTANDALNKLNKRQNNVKYFKQISALGVLAGDASENNKKVLLSDASMSTFMSYFILSALAKTGEYDYALNSLREYYNGMLSVGATTFWEDFDLKWLENAGRIDEFPQDGVEDIHGDRGMFCYTGYRHSLCHGWSAGVVAYLSETVLGVKAVGTGRKKFKIEPHLSYLKNVKGTVPTAFGKMEIEHIKMSDGSIKTTVKAPDGIEIL